MGCCSSRRSWRASTTAPPRSSSPPRSPARCWAPALADGLGGWDWLALVLLLAIGALTVVLLWPYYHLSFRFDAQDLLDTYVDRQPPATMAGMHRELALRIKADWHRNGRIVRRLQEAFQLALILVA